MTVTRASSGKARENNSRLVVQARKHTLLGVTVERFARLFAARLPDNRRLSLGPFDSIGYFAISIVVHTTEERRESGVI